jgi:hypothetical protein
MRTVIVGLLSVGLVAVAADTSDAASKKHRRSYESYAQTYPLATPRQQRNAWAYTRYARPPLNASTVTMSPAFYRFEKLRRA